MAHEETAVDEPAGPADSDDAALVAALRDGDEAALAALIDRYYVVSETFRGLIQGIDRFEARSIPTGVGSGRRAPRATLLDALRRAR